MSDEKKRKAWVAVLSNFSTIPFFATKSQAEEFKRLGITENWVESKPLPEEGASWRH